MKATPEGRHCSKCSTTVIDFTSATDEAIRSYFAQHTGGVCGRFYKSQTDRIRIEVPGYLLRKPMPYWKKFLLIFLLCLSSSIITADLQLSGSSLYAQSGISKKKPGKPQKKRHRKAKANYTFDIPMQDIQFETLVLGFTVTEKAYLPVDAHFPPDACYPQNSTPANTLPDSSETLAGTKPGQTKQPVPDKHEPLPKTEFVLPAVWLRKKLRRVKAKH